MTSDSNKRIAKNTLYLYIRLIFVLLVSLYTSRVVLHALGVVDFGVYNVVAGFVSMLALLSTSLTNSVQRFYNYEIGKNGSESIQKIYISSLYIQVIIAVIILILAETIGLWYIENKMVYPSERESAVFIVFQISVVALLLTVMQIPYTAVIIAHERINYYAIVGVLDVLLKLLIAFFISHSNADRLVLYGVLIASVSFIDFVFYFVYSKKYFPALKCQKKFYGRTFKEMLSFSGWSALNGLSQTIKNQGVNMIMNFFLGPVVNTARGISYQIKSALLGFVMNITTATQPQMIESYSNGDTARSERMLYSMSKLVFLSLFIVVLPLISQVGLVLQLWLGPDYPEYTEIFTILVLIITLVDILMTPISIIINANGHIRLYSTCISVIELLTLPLAYIILKMGCEPQYVFVMSFGLSVVAVIISLIIMQYKTGIRIADYLRNVIVPLSKVLFPSVLFVSFISFVRSSGLFLSLVTFAVIALVASLLGYYLALDSGERSMVKTIVEKFRKRLLKPHS